MGANLISTDPTALILTLLPRTIGRFKRDGLWVNKLRYHCDGFTEQYLNGGTCTAAYNPEDVTSVWLVDAGCYTEFTLIDSRYQHKNLTEVQEMQSGQRMLIKGTERDNLQAQILLADHIEAIADSAVGCMDVNMKSIRSNRKREQGKYHRDYMREDANHD
jgi:hypothetical protein